MDATEKFVEFDQQLVAASKGIKILSALGWGEKVGDEFLEGWRKGNPKLPVVHYPRFEYTEEKLILK